mgnify:CR=1 FL=1
MKLRNTAIALGVGAATATGLSLLKVNKDLVIGSTAVVVGAGLMISLRDEEELKINSLEVKNTQLKEIAYKEMEKGNSKDAISNYLIYLKDHKDDIEALNNLGHLYRVTNCASDSEKIFKKILKLDNKNKTAMYNLGVLKQDCGDCESAIYWYDKTIELGTNDGDIYFNRALAKSKLKYIVGIISDLEKSYDLGCKDAGLALIKILHSKAEEEYSEGRIKNAIQYCSDALDIDSTHLESLVNRAIFKTELGDYLGAIEDYKKRIEIDPKKDDGYFDLGLTKMKEGNSQEQAIEDFNKVISINPSYQQAFNMRGLVKRELGQLNNSLEDFNQAIQLDPKYANAFTNRGGAKYALKDYEGAIADHSKAIEIVPEERNYYFNRANARKEIGDLKGACEDWKKAAELGDEDAAKLVEEHCE